MKKLFLKTMVLVGLTFLFIKSLVAEDNSTINWEENHVSIGLNNIPFAAPNYVEFRTWKNASKGFKIMVRGIPYILYENNVGINLDSIELSFLTRNKYKLINNFTYYKGIGISLGTDGISYIDNNRKEIRISSGLIFPVGIEHFFLKSLPNISYSAEANFIFSLKLHYYSTRQEPIGNSNIERFIWWLKFETVPRFFIHWYFK